ncbi:MAG TPA: flagellar protein FlaG [Thiotrichales bacterium]|nr:flagellar protein FlaG [Thiotrichales bacterium]
MAIDSLSLNSTSMVKPMSAGSLSGTAMADRSSGVLVATERAEVTAPADTNLVSIPVLKQGKSQEQQPLDESSVQRMNESLQKAGSNILFEPDEDSGKMLFLMKDAETGETIRQIPNEVVLKISQAIGDFLNQAQIEGKSNSNSSLPSALSGLVTNLMA